MVLPVAHLERALSMLRARVRLHRIRCCREQRAGVQVAFQSGVNFSLQASLLSCHT